MIFILCREIRKDNKMAFLFSKEEFVSKLKERAEKRNLLQAALSEIEAYDKYDQLEYLAIVEKFIEVLKEIDVPYSYLRMAGATSVVAYLLGISKINPVNHGLSNRFFFDYEFKDGGIGPRFDICIPKSKKDEALKVLNRLCSINPKTSDASIIRFGENDKYRIGIYGSSYLDRLTDTIKIMINDNLSRWCSKEFDHIQDTDDNYNDVIKYMLADDGKGFCLPNLNGCVLGVPSDLYELIDAGKPKNLCDLAKINCLMYGVFKSKKKLLESLKENGLDGTIYIREQLFELLVSNYDIQECDAYQIAEDIIQKRELTEWEDLVLKSHEVPKFILEQLDNIKYLHYMSASLQEIVAAYYMAEIKMWLPGDFEKLLPVPYKHSFVGPFFYINKRLYSYTDSMTNHNGNVRFFDAPISHFEYFDTLGIDGDYGNYPRGRVIFDNFHKQFIVYLDKDLMTEDIKMSIMLAYCLEEGQTIFKRDSHYTHNDL